MTSTWAVEDATAVPAARAAGTVAPRAIALSTANAVTAMKPTISLTPREREVLCLLARGCTYLQVSDRLGMSCNTVASHIKNIYRKLEVRSARGAIWRALELQLLDAAAAFGGDAA